MEETLNYMKTNDIMREYVSFLDSCFSQVKELLNDRSYTTNESSFDDWLQVNWEFLVERKLLPLNKYLEVYGNGGDYNGESSRITDIHCKPTNVIIVVIDECEDILNNEIIINKEFRFDRFVSFDGYYYEKPTYECTLVIEEITNKERVFYNKEIRFDLASL